MKAYYQEKYYLNGDRESLETIERKRRKNTKDNEREKESFSKTISLYDTYIEEVTEFLKTLDLSSSLEYSIALENLMSKGYFSLSKQFEREEPKQDLSTCMGLSVLMGKGCCRNITSFHTDVLEKLNRYHKRFYCCYDYPFKRGKNNPADHMISLIKDHKTIYGIDLNNGVTLYHFTSPFILKSLSVYSSNKLSYKPYIEMLYDESDVKDIKKTIKRFAKESEKRPISPLEYEVMYNHIFHHVSKQEQKAREFHEKTKTLKKEIISSYEKRR